MTGSAPPKITDVHGYVVVDKPAGISTFDLVRAARRGCAKSVKIGHAGTLDPFATGLVILLFGQATRLMNWVSEGRKTYRAVIQLGAVSTTDDCTGELTIISREFPAFDAVTEACAAVATRDTQVPPAVSALHIDGKRAYQRVRNGETVVIEPRPCTIYSIDLCAYDQESGRLTVDVECASGTYIRSIARDIGELLECGGHAAQLRRTQVGSCNVIDAIADHCAVSRSEIQPMSQLITLPRAHVASEADVADLLFGRAVTVVGDAHAGDVALLSPISELVAIGSAASDQPLEGTTTYRPHTVVATTTAQPSVTAIGVFDGVHGGHQQLLKVARRVSGEGQRVLALTFDPHPLTVVRPEATIAHLATLPERISLLKRYGADDVGVIPFDSSVAACEPAMFVAEWLHVNCNAKQVVVGENFRFGHKAAGDISMLQVLCADLGISVTVVDAHCSGSVPVSSSIIRRTLADDGDVRSAAELLGRPWTLRGDVIHGEHRGRELGFPTANLAVDPILIHLAHGVYAATARTMLGTFAAAVSIGTNPQFKDGSVTHVEAYLLDFPDAEIGNLSSSLYGTSVELSFVDRVREQLTFNGVDELVAQIQHDVQFVSALIARNGDGSPFPDR